MYRIELILGTFKQYVRNKAYLEYSIAEAYIINKAMTFCSMYFFFFFFYIETKFNRPERNYVVDIYEIKKLLIFKNNIRSMEKRK